MENYQDAYREETHELLSELETSLLELEQTPEDQNLIGRVFRAMHTIKGSGSMFGFDEIAAFTHEIETVFDLVRQRKITFTPALTNLTLSACDQIQKMVNGEKVDPSVKEKIVETFRSIRSQPGHNGATESLDSVTPNTRKEEPASNLVPGAVTYRIRFRPHPGLLATGTNPILLLDELRSLGSHQITAQLDAVPRLKELNTESCYLYWDIILTTTEDINAIKDVFIFVEDVCDLTIEAVDASESGETATEYKRLGEILVERGDVKEADLTRVLKEQKRIGEMLKAVGAADDGIITSALAEQQRVKEVRQERNEKLNAASIRVAAEKLDTLVDLVGELVTVQASLSQKALAQKDPELISISEQVERLTEELRDNAMSIRMVPIGTTFSRFKRLIRDLSSELGKEVRLVTEGGETELDKTVIEKLNDPLVHIIRNSIDHGIESPEARRNAGKALEGTIRISAVHAGPHVLIRISDDGKGLDPTAIRATALERGLISQDDELTEKELFSQIFAPGFSTAKQVTDISGRGVGMDVVKRSVEALRGFIEVDSVEGQGTTITFRLPLTLAIIDGLLVNIGGDTFVLPLSVVEECVELKQSEIGKNNGRHIIEVRGRPVPYILLRDLFMVEIDPPEIQQIAICDVDGFQVGFVVDFVIGEHQTVIKALGRSYRSVTEFSGATILADGNVALILDVNRLIQTLESDER
jgi:two-component system, chemotaxis family, sensor kinase CheA